MGKMLKLPRKLNQRWRFDTVRRLDFISATESHLLKELVDRGNLSGHCWIKSQTLAKDMRVSVKTIDRALKSLRGLGLIRYWPSIKRDGNKGVRHIAVTLPIGQVVPASGQMGTKIGDTESEHNIKIQHNSNTEPYRIPSLERAVFKVLEDRLDRHGHPQLISMYELTVWLFNRSEEDWEQLQAFVLEEAEALAKELKQGKYRLRAWSHFIDRLDATERFSKTRMDHKRAKTLHTDLRALLRPVKGYHSSMLDGALFETEGDLILINCRTLLDRDRLLAIGEPALQALANQEDAPICLVTDAGRSRPFYPDSYG